MVCSNELVSELISPLSSVQISFAIIFHYFSSCNFAHIQNLGFSLDVILKDEICFLMSLFILENSGCKLWELIKKVSVFGTRQGKYAYPWGSGGHARG